MGRNATIDYARLLAAFGIVIFHAKGPGAQIGYAALPFFLMLLVVTASPGARRSDFRPYATARAGRLLRPWLIWSGIYGALKLGEVIVVGIPFRTEFSSWMLLTGPALHLWFLPFALVTSLAIHPIIRWQTNETRRAVLLVILAVSTLFALGLWEQFPTLPIPITQWLYALPAVLLGLAIAVCSERPLWQIAFSIAVCAVAFGLGWTSNLSQAALAAAGLIFCLNWRVPTSWLSRWMASVSLGVYLAHPLVLSILQRALGEHQGGVFLTLSACIGALVIASVMEFALKWRRDRQNTFP